MVRLTVLTLIVAVTAAFAVTAAVGSGAGAPHMCTERSGLPDRRCTPGAVDARVSQRTIASTICRRGYTARVRPPVSYTEPLKLRQMRQYGYYAGRSPSAYEEDHLIPLELGGSPRDPRNLWPEAHNVPSRARGSVRKDVVENALRRKVCAGSLSLHAAQTRIATDWETALGG